MKLKLLSLFLLALLTVPALGQRSSAENAVPQLRDLPAFTDTEYGGWAGSGGGSFLVVDGDSTLPVDEAVVYNGNPSFRFDVSGQFGWWQAIVAGPLWETYDIAPYHANGTLNFFVRDLDAGEDFTIALATQSPGANPEQQTSNAVNATSYTSPNNGWQAVSIPLADLVPNPATFPLDQILTIQFSDATGQPQQFWINSLTYQSSDPVPTYPAIKINQVAYAPNAEKVAVISGFSGNLLLNDSISLKIRRVSNDNVVYSAPLTLATANDVDSGESVWHADFSGLTSTGSFYASLDYPGVDDSPAFSINSSPYDSLLVDAMRYFYIQRQGVALPAEYAGPYSRGVGTPDDASAHRLGDISDVRDVSQGWYDAGDYGKYVSPGAHAVHDLLWAFELYPSVFPDNQLNIPESGNGTPDILDEIRWELDWLMKMQDDATGGFYHMVQPTENMSPDEQTGARYIDDEVYGETDVKPTVATATTVAALAHAAAVFQPFDASYAAELLDSAEFGWQYLVANPDFIWTDYNDPYADTSFVDADNRLWAAAALFRATGDNQYESYFLNNYESVLSTMLSEGFLAAYGTTDSRLPALLAYAAADDADASTVNRLRAGYTIWRNAVLDRQADSAWRTAVAEGQYWWGSNMTVLNHALFVAVADDLFSFSGSADVDFSQGALDYILGVNPLQMTYVTGYGDNPLPTIYSNIFAYDNVAQAAPGYLSGGPNVFTNEMIFSEFPAKAIMPNTSSFTTNENTVYWNSALVFVVAQLQADAALR